MGERTVSREDVQGRARAMGMAAADPPAAAKAAKSIGHPWYRCQALAEAANFSEGRARAKLLQAAFSAAEEQEEPNRVVTVSAWPLRVLAETDPTAAADELRRLVDIAEREPHNLRRAHALQTLALMLGKHVGLLRVLAPALAAAILGGGGPRMDRVIRDTFPLIAKSNPELLERLALHHKPNAQQQKLLAQLREQEI